MLCIDFHYDLAMSNKQYALVYSLVYLDRVRALSIRLEVYFAIVVLIVAVIYVLILKVTTNINAVNFSICTPLFFLFHDICVIMNLRYGYNVSSSRVYIMHILLYIVFINDFATPNSEGINL